jgi:hypothetical protein
MTKEIIEIKIIHDEGKYHITLKGSKNKEFFDSHHHEVVESKKQVQRAIFFCLKNALK